ncbi:MAG: hypothetical protein M3310_06130 [Actinomycetota bacterium]|nr:hypothetical protein [Actinomycetota bacterium]
MASEERAVQPAITPLPRVEDLPTVAQGYDPERVREAFDAFRRHTVQLQAQLRVLQAAGQSPNVDPTGHAVRMDALHLIREAATFADILERDAQRASAAQLSRTEQEVRRRQTELARRETEIDRFRQESERQRAEILNTARNEARQLLADANRQATQELRESEARGARLLEQARHQATELTNSARAEVEQTLEWARAQANTIMARAQQGAEQLLAAAGLGEEAIAEVSEAILRTTQAEAAAPPERQQVSDRPVPVAAVPDVDGAQAPEQPGGARETPDQPGTEGERTEG